MNRDGITGQFVVELFPIFQGYSPPGVRKCGFFLHEPQQTTDLKFVDQLKIKSSDHMTFTI